jgi:hypothetical protein
MGEEKTSYQRVKQFLKQQKQIDGRNPHIYTDMNTECQWTQLPHQKEDLTISSLQETHLIDRNKH